MILISLECAGRQQRNGTSLVCIRCMVLEMQLFLIHGFQKVVAPCFRELGPHKSRKNLAKILPQDASKKEQETTSENT